MHDQSPSGTESDEHSTPWLATNRIDGHPRHHLPQLTQKLSQLVVVAQHSVRSKFSQQRLGSLKPSVILHQVNRADLEHTAELNDGLANRQISAILNDSISGLEAAVVLEKTICCAESACARVVVERKHLGRHLEQCGRVSDAKSAPATNGLHAGLRLCDDPILDLERVLLVGRYILGGCNDNANSLHPSDGRQRHLFPFVVGPVKRREIVQHCQRGLHAEKIFVGDTRSQHMHQYLSVGELIRQLALLVDI
mmetsp:Transcript_50909/g.84370  ORF Transcript_50909/g.84370 Transcript_50909/m.84370 type:complete len:252 (-) Transcript_50909:645-1400(-)